MDSSKSDLVQRFLQMGAYTRNWSKETSKTYRDALDSFRKTCSDVPANGAARSDQPSHDTQPASRG